MMKNKLIYPFALTALVAALAGCGGGGGESANIIQEPDEQATTNGSCDASTSNCIEWGLEYPIDGLNFDCSSDKENKFITLFNETDGVATGSCQKNDTINFYVQSFSNTKIKLGSLKLSEFATISTSSQLPRLNVLDIARGITGKTVTKLDPSDQTVQVAMKLAKIWQALALQQNNINEPTDIQPLYISDEMRKALGKISGDIELNSSDFESKIKPFVDVSVISDADAFTVVKKLANITTAAVYQPEFSLFSTSGIGTSLSGSDGLVGCNKNDCDVSDKSVKHLFGHFMLVTDRQGYTFGSGLQWRDSQLKLANSQLTSLGGINAELLRKVKPQQMTADPQTSWINPATRRIDSTFAMKVAQSNNPLEFYQGTMLSDYVIAGKEAFYKVVTGKTTLDSNDTAKLGKWRFNADSEAYAGTVDLYKIYPISYLDRKIFKTEKNVAKSEKYIFPMYANLVFSFTDKTISPVTVGIVIDSQGDVRTNMQSASNLATHSSQGCQGDVLKSSMLDSLGVQQYRVGTLGRAFTDTQNLSMRLVFANPIFANVNGALVGMNSTIQTSTDQSQSIVVGGALLSLANVLNTNAGEKGRVAFSNSVGDGVSWANTYASFQQVYNNANTDETQADIDIAKLSGGSVEFKLADCYTVKQK
jgi:hypothetical protein